MTEPKQQPGDNTPPEIQQLRTKGRTGLIFFSLIGIGVCMWSIMGDLQSQEALSDSGSIIGSLIGLAITSIGILIFVTHHRRANRVLWLMKNVPSQRRMGRIRTERNGGSEDHINFYNYFLDLWDPEKEKDPATMELVEVDKPEWKGSTVLLPELVDVIFDPNPNGLTVVSTSKGLLIGWKKRREI